MAMSLTVEQRWVTNGRVHVSGYGNLGVYATNGVPMAAPRLMGLGTIDNFTPGLARGVAFQWDKLTATVLAYGGVAVGEAPDGTDLTTYVFRWQANGAY